MRHQATQQLASQAPLIQEDSHDGRAHPPLTSALASAFERYARHDCLSYFGRRVRYEAVSERARRVARCLQQAGIGEGDRVMVVLPNMPEAVYAILGVLWCGATVVMANPLASAGDHAFQVQDSGVKLVITLDALAGRFAAMSTAAGHALGVWPCTLDASMPVLTAWAARITGRLPKPADKARGPNVKPFARAWQEGPVLSAMCPRTADSPAVFIYTGGTTGKPKAVVLSLGNLSANVHQITGWLDTLPDGQTNVLGVFPFFSAAGLTALLMHTLTRGGMLVLLPRPDADAITTALKQQPVHVLPGVPTIFRGLLAHHAFRVEAAKLTRHVKACLSGAAPLDEACARQWLKLTGQPILELYGMTETTAMAFGNRPGMAIKTGSVGKALPGLRCHIEPMRSQADAGGAGVGEVWLQGPQIAQGYYRNPAETHIAFVDGWLRTGDLGYLDQDGYLFLRGRSKEMVISSGYNVYPTEIEDMLLRHPAIAEAACTGVPDEYRGEAVLACIVLKPGCALNADELSQWCVQHLARYKVPRDFRFLDSLPRNPLGKVLKNQLVNG